MNPAAHEIALDLPAGSFSSVATSQHGVVPTPVTL